MAGSDQKTVMATEVPPEVAARLAEQKVVSSGAGGAAAARTVIATAGPPPPAQGYGPPAAVPPPMGAGAPLRSTSPNPQATVMMSPSPQAAPAPAQAARPSAPPLPLQPASAVLRPPVTGAIGPAPATLWVGGPALARALGLATLLVTNRVWPRVSSGVLGHPTVAGEVGQVQIVTVPPGATVLVEGVEQKERTPMHVDGPPGKSAKVRVVAKGYEPYDVVVQYPKDSRPPLNIKLAGLGQATGHDQDPTLYHDREGTKTTPDEEDTKPARQPEPPKVAATDQPKEEDTGDEPAETPAVKGSSRHGHHGRGQAAAADKGQAAAPDTGQAAPDQAPDKAADGPAIPHGKGLLSVTVHPWAIVYIDGHKLQQTPLRDYPISPGKHSLLLVNDTKGKRETVPLNVTAGQPYSVSKSWD